MTPLNMPKKLGATPPKPKRHHDECRCLDCIDMNGQPTRKPGITSDRVYRAARKAAGL